MDAKQGELKLIKSGYVMILGLPNVGKSTLMNRLIKEKLSIVTPKPQTTRNRILGIAQGTDYQMLFLDTPGFCKATSKLNEFLISEIDRAFVDADVICFMVEADHRPTNAEVQVIKKVKEIKVPTILLINKIDLVKKTRLLPLIQEFSELHEFDEIMPVSSLNGYGCEELFELLIKYLPYGPRYYPEDDLSDISERFLASEIIREKVFLATRHEIPYSTAVVVTSFKEQEERLDIDAEIYVERESQKGIVIGKGGNMLKKIGTAARADMEAFFGKHVNVKLMVKVKEGWSKHPGKLRELGYE